MIYPKWLKQGDTIGITAPSSGVPLDQTEEIILAEKNLKLSGFEIKETESVRSGNDPSAAPEIRAQEWAELVMDDQVKLILCAKGGDFLYEMLPYTDIASLLENPKWVQGYSDPTGLLYGITTCLDMATIYSHNATGFAMNDMHRSMVENIDLWKGDLTEQYSFDLYEAKRADSMDGYDLSNPVYWETPNGDVDVTGRLIGGCMESLLDLIGTPYENTLDFIKRYKKDGMIWYFDIFSMPAESVYRTLLHMKACGWFEGAKGFIFGRVVFPGTYVDMSYEQAVTGALGRGIPVVMEADVGHVNPRMSFVNGCVAHLEAKEGRGKMTYMFI